MLKLVRVVQVFAVHEKITSSNCDYYFALLSPVVKFPSKHVKSSLYRPASETLHCTAGGPIVARDLVLAGL